MKPQNIIRIAGVVMALLCSSCNEWLDVKPDNKVLEDDLLENEAGFKTALNGVYLGLANENLYGKELSCGYIEALAQMYNIIQLPTGNSNVYLFFTQYEYTNSTVKSYFDNTWQKMYDLIANCNNLIEQAALRKEIFSDEGGYNSYVSELYALRAFMHFDLFRLWGPMYSDGTKEMKCIPYYKKRLSLPTSYSTAAEVVRNILDDLHVADSLAPAGAKSYKMNISRDAIRALRARVYLYAGEKELAYEETKSLFDGNIAVRYPFVTATAVQEAIAPDRLFYPEQIFLLENSKRNKLYEDMFDYMLGDEVFLAPLPETISQLFPNLSDYRYGWWTVNPGNGKGISSVKFAKITDNSNPVRTRGQSLLKVSELYLIMAECAPTEEERIEYLNRLRVGRGYQSGSISDAEKNNWATTLQEEYKREFYGEGQYFFYLKRNHVASLPAGTGNGDFVMGSAQYVLPVPDSEALYR